METKALVPETKMSLTKISVHRTYEDLQIVHYIHKKHDAQVRGDVQRIVGLDAFEEWYKSIPRSQIISTLADTTDAILMEIGKYHDLYGFNWHSAGIEKDLGADELVAIVLVLPRKDLRPIIIRPELVELKFWLSKRNILLEQRTKAVQRLKSLYRQAGRVCTEQYDEENLVMLSEAQNIKARNSKGEQFNLIADIEKGIENRASQIRECQIFNELAGITGSWILAASLVVAFKGFENFEQVASVWKYAGEHVVEGKAPKRAKGQAVDWNPKVRVLMYQLGTNVFIMKKREPWRGMYEEFRALEWERHPQNCGCKQRDGHSTNRAIRKTRKEFLKQFFLLCKGSAHAIVENQSRGGVPKLCA